MKDMLTIEDFLNDETETKTIDIDCFKLPEGLPMPSVTLKVNDDTRRKYKISKEKHNTIKNPRFTSRGITGKIVNEPDKFCEDMLTAGYESSEGFSSCDSILTNVRKYAKFAQYLASAIIDIFDAAEKFKKEEEETDEKN